MVQFIDTITGLQEDVVIELDTTLERLLNAAYATNKKGSMNLTLAVAPERTKFGTVMVLSVKIDAKELRHDVSDGHFYCVHNKEGAVVGLSRDNPEQQKLLFSVSSPNTGRND